MCALFNVTNSVHCCLSNRIVDRAREPDATNTTILKRKVERIVSLTLVVNLTVLGYELFIESAIVANRTRPVTAMLLSVVYLPRDDPDEEPRPTSNSRRSKRQRS